MKFKVEVFEQGVLVASDESDKKFNYAFLDKEYRERINAYVENCGYIKMCASTEGSTVLVNKEYGKALMLSYKLIELTDFTDMDGNVIRIGEKLLSERGDEFGNEYYKILKCNDELYLRCVSHRSVQGKYKDGKFYGFTDEIPDVYNITQSVIDSKRLRIIR